MILTGEWQGRALLIWVVREDLSEEDDVTWDPDGEKNHVEFCEPE